MKTCGLIGIALAALGLILALFVWIFWTFIAQEVAFDGAMYWVARIAEILETLCLFGAVILACFGLVVAKR